MDAASDTTRKIGEESISKLLLTYSLPVYVSYIANSIYNIISRAFIGNSIGSDGIAAISVVFPITLLQMSFGFLLGMGGSTLAAIKVGEGNKETANRILNLSVQMIVVLAVIITTFGNLFIDELLTALGASEDVLPYARDYGRILLFGCLFQMIAIGITNYIRVEGKTGLAMLSVIIGPVVNIIFACLFILILNWELKGAALATVLGQFACALLIIVHFVKNKGFFRLNKFVLKIDIRKALKVIYLGLSPFTVQFCQGMVNIFLNVVIRRYGGDIAISGMGIVTTLQMFVTTPVQAVNMGSQALIGYNYGSKKYQRIKELVKKGIIATTSILAAEYIIIRLFTTEIVSIFSAEDIELIAFSSRALVTFLFLLPLVPLQIQGAGFFQAIGKPVYSVLLSLSRQAIILIPALFILPEIYGLEGVLYAGPVSDFISFAVTVPLLIYHLRRLIPANEIAKQGGQIKN
jgi:putative MATE family efflux protein